MIVGLRTECVSTGPFDKRKDDGNRAAKIKNIN